MTQEESVAVKGERALEWIEELISGTYKQKRYELGSPSSGFCCLGVANYLCGSPINRTEGLLVDGVHNRVGLLSALGRSHSHSSATLASLNDVYGHSLVAIGEMLLEYPHLYFEKDVAKYIKEHGDELL